MEWSAFNVLMPMLPYSPAAMIPVSSPKTLQTVCHEKRLIPWYAMPKVNWPWNAYMKIPYIIYTTPMSSCAQHCNRLVCDVVTYN